MITSPRLRLAPLWWTGAIILTALIVYFSLEPPSGVVLPNVSDKVKHFGAYCGLAFWFAGLTERRIYPGVAVALILLGGLMELAQGAMGLGRTLDWRDFLANTLGIATALGVAYAGLGSWMIYIERRLGVS